MPRRSRSRRPMTRPVRDHRCEPITVAERHHYDVPPSARWTLSYEQFHGTRGWVRHRRWVDEERARFWCTQVGIAFPAVAPPAPAAALVAPPPSCAHDPDWGVTREPLVDLRARAAGDDVDAEPAP